MRAQLPLAPPDAYKAVLAAARRHGCRMTRTKVAKLLYLADVRAMESQGRRATTLQWMWWNYGPYTSELQTLEKDFVKAGDVERKWGYNYFGSDEVTLALSEHVEEPTIDAELARILDEVVSEFGPKAPTTLKNLTYDTSPMREAQSGGRFKEPLDLELVRRLPTAKRSLRRLRRRLAALPEQSTDAGATEALLDDIESLRETRARANRRSV